MKRRLRATMFVLGGCCWIAAAFVCVTFVLAYVARGAGLQFWPVAISSGSVLMGLVHVAGFVSASALCFVVGIGLCGCGLVGPSRRQPEMEAMDCFSVRVGEIGRTIEYGDLQGEIRFTFTLSPLDQKSLLLEQHAHAYARPRYGIAVERTKQHLERLGFSVELGG